MRNRLYYMVEESSINKLIMRMGEMARGMFLYAMISFSIALKIHNLLNFHIGFCFKLLFQFYILTWRTKVHIYYVLL